MYKQYQLIKKSIKPIFSFKKTVGNEKCKNIFMQPQLNITKTIKEKTEHALINTNIWLYLSIYGDIDTEHSKHP